MKCNNKKLGRKQISLILVWCCICLLPLSVAAESEPLIKKYSAVARKSIDFGRGASPQKLEFRFDNASAWVRENGTFQLEAEIKHGWLLCGTYEVGINFGIGSPACTNVSWIGKPRYVSKRKQCNHAWMVHTGTDIEPEVVGDFNQITCAQLLIKCTGKCK